MNCICRIFSTPYKKHRTPFPPVDYFRYIRLMVFKTFRFSQIVFFILIFFSALNSNLFGQKFQIGTEHQVYLTGYIPSVIVQYSANGTWTYQARFGYNLIRHRDLGEHEDERGSGWGGSLAALRQVKTKWKFGLRCDVWFNDIDWKDNIGTVGEISGNTKITVLQPTAVGYYCQSINENLEIWPSLAFGFEANVKTDGADVGQGLILLGGLSVLFNL